MEMKRLALAILIIGVLSLGFTYVYSYNFTGFSDAVRSGNVKYIESSLKEKPGVSRVLQVIDEAVKHHQSGSAKVLLNYLKSKNVDPDLLLPLLVQVAGNGNTKITEMIFQCGLTPYDAGKYMYNPVERSLRYGKVDTAIYLINKGVKHKGLVAIFNNVNSQVSEKKKLELVGALIKNNPNMDQNEWGIVLAYAADTGDIALVDKILERCAARTINTGLKTGFKYNTPFEVVPRFDTKMLDHLFLRGADPKSPEAIGALNFAMAGLDLEMVKYFLDKGVPVNDTSRMNVLTDAVQVSDLEIVKLLIERGADVNRNYYIVNGSKKYGSISPLRGAIEKLDPEMVELLLKNGAKTDTEFTPKESLLAELKNIRDSIEWFDFRHLKDCRLIEKMLKEVK